ncbi:hypothetical protein ACFQZC_16810 [Streptacidiphilus monticola]
MYVVLVVGQVTVPQRVEVARQATSEVAGSTSSVGVPTRSVTMAKKRRSIRSWSGAVMVSVCASGWRPS